VVIPDPLEPAETAEAAPTPEPKPKRSRVQRAKDRVASAAEQLQSSGEPGTTTPSTTGSTDRPKFVETKQLEDDLTQALRGASEIANDRFTPGTPLLLADEPEARGVAGPAARIIGRNLPAGMAEPNAQDAFAAGITLARYLLRQVRLYFEVKRAHAAAGQPEAEQEPTSS
jgi:hypothetical protein